MLKQVQHDTPVLVQTESFMPNRYMKKFLKLKWLCVGIIGISLIALGFEIQDSYRKHGPFRAMQDPISTSEQLDLTGLREMRFTGGPLVSLPALQKRLQSLKGPKILVDGIHGKYGYICGVPDNYLDYYKESPSWKAYLWRLFYTGTFLSQSSLIVPAAEAARAYGFQHANFHIGSKYLTKDADIDKFVSFIDNLPKDTWVYFHCTHGKGRTSLMLVMADIMRNAPTVALADIVKRQYVLGSVDLFDTTSWTRSTYGRKTLDDRKRFVEKFYDFICQRKTGGVQQWSVWNHE